MILPLGTCCDDDDGVDALHAVSDTTTRDNPTAIVHLRMSIASHQMVLTLDIPTRVGCLDCLFGQAPSRRTGAQRFISSCQTGPVERSDGTQSPCDGTVGVDATWLDRIALLALLRRTYSKRKAGSILDLRGVDLSTADIRVPLRNIDFRCANLRMATTRSHILHCDLRWADLRGAMLREATFSAVDLRHADLRDTDLRHANFGRASVSGGFKGCNLLGAQLVGADLRGSTWSIETIWPEGFDPDVAGAVQV
jgi:hypothetical protein